MDQQQHRLLNSSGGSGSSSMMRLKPGAEERNAERARLARLAYEARLMAAAEARLAKAKTEEEARRAQAAKDALYEKQQAEKRLQSEQAAALRRIEAARRAAEQERLRIEQEQEEARRKGMIMRAPAEVLLVDREPGETQAAVAGVRPRASASAVAASSSSDYDDSSSSASSSSEAEEDGVTRGGGGGGKGLLKSAMTFQPGAGKGLLKTAMMTSQPPPPSFRAGAGKGVFASASPPSPPAAGGGGKGLLTNMMATMVRRSSSPTSSSSDEEDGETSDASSSSSGGGEGSRAPPRLRRTAANDEEGWGGVRLPMESEEGEVSSSSSSDEADEATVASAAAPPHSREWRSVANSRYLSGNNNKPPPQQQQQRPQHNNHNHSKGKGKQAWRRQQPPPSSSSTTITTTPTTTKVLLLGDGGGARPSLVGERKARLDADYNIDADLLEEEEKAARKKRTPVAMLPRPVPAAFVSSSSSSDEDGWGDGRVKRQKKPASAYQIEGVAPALGARSELEDAQRRLLDHRYWLHERREEDMEETPKKKLERERMHLARLPAPLYGPGPMTAAERAAFDAETAALAADAARLSERAQEKALEDARAEALEASKAEFIQGVEARRNDPARPQTLVLSGDHLRRLEALVPERRALIEDGRLRRLGGEGDDTDGNGTTTTVGGKKETFAYETTLGDALRFSNGGLQELVREMERSDAAALKQAEEAKLAKALDSYNKYRAKCGREKKPPSVADFMRDHPPDRYTIVWTDHEGKAKRTAPTERFLRALRTQLGEVEQADLRTDLYFNNPLAALAAERSASSKNNKKRPALDLGDVIDRQLAMRPQKQKQQTRAAEEEEVDEAEKEEASSFFYLREKEAANTQHYPVYIVTPSWDKDDERAQKAKGNRLLNPTYDEAHAAEPNDCPQMTWEAVVFRFAKPSEIGKDKLYDPFVRPIALVAGGRLTVRRRRYKKEGSQPERGFIRVVADERFGYDARAAYVERRMREWRHAMHARHKRPEALGYVDARPGDDAFQPQNEGAAFARFHEEYSTIRDRKLTKENLAEIAGSSSRRSR